MYVTKVYCAKTNSIKYNNYNILPNIFYKILILSVSKVLIEIYAKFIKSFDLSDLSKRK